MWTQPFSILRIFSPCIFNCQKWWHDAIQMYGSYHCSNEYFGHQKNSTCCIKLKSALIYIPLKYLILLFVNNLVVYHKFPLIFIICIYHFSLIIALRIMLLFFNLIDKIYQRNRRHRKLFSSCSTYFCLLLTLTNIHAWVVSLLLFIGSTNMLPVLAYCLLVWFYFTTSWLPHPKNKSYNCCLICT